MARCWDYASSPRHRRSRGHPTPTRRRGPGAIRRHTHSQPAALLLSRPSRQPGRVHEDRGGLQRVTLKTSLGIWALGPMITRFVPVGYQPQWTAENIVDKVGRAVAGLGDLIDDYEF